jgi:hypothetical protein
MKTLLSLLFSAALFSPAMATVSIEFQFGAINVPTGSLGVLVADVNGDGFHSPAASPGTTLTAKQKIGADDVIVRVFSNANLSDWGNRRGFADQFAMLDYEFLEVAEGQTLILYVFPDRVAGNPLRTGEPHLAYRGEDLDDFSSHSNMEFALPADGGAYRLAVLATEVGGDADLATMDIGRFPLSGSSGNLGRSLAATAEHTYYFDFSGSGAFSLFGVAPPGLVASLYDPAGNLISESEGTGNFIFNENLLVGIYTLVLSNGPGTGALAYNLDFSSSGLRSVRPDVAVGLSMAGLNGVGVYGTPSGQTITLTSKKARSVTGMTSVTNTGALPDSLNLSGMAGSSFFAVTYLGPAGNMTAGLITGTANTPEMDDADIPFTIRTTITPNKRKLMKKRGKKTIYLKKSHTTMIRATSDFDPGMSDFGIIRVQTR